MNNGTPIALPLRFCLGVEILFGIGAVLAIGVSPADTATNFAWPIQPVVMAAVLGAFYMSSALLFVVPFFARRWEMIRVMILPTAVFSTVQLLATFLHWDKFSVGTMPFYVWFASYLLPPPIFLTAYLWHQRRAAAPTSESDSPLPGWMRTLFWVVGADYGEVKRMFVRPQFRGLGLGKLMLDRLSEFALETQVNILRLETGIYQTEAIQLYEKYGFKRRSPFGEYKIDPLSIYFEKALE